uniref:Choline/ethanolamine phosphotransferase n=1 Tax=Panagrolaimus sp. JU765 TaxID=591449 RepID=A0AC34QXQ8_9BILA
MHVNLPSLSSAASSPSFIGGGEHTTVVVDQLLLDSAEAHKKSLSTNRGETVIIHLGSADEENDILLDKETMPVQTRSARLNRSSNNHGKIKAIDALANIWRSYLESDCILSNMQIQRLGDHKYSATDISWLDELCMKKFWEKCVVLCPMWLAPNLITLVGMLINLTTMLILSNYCWSAREEAPSWVYFQAALGLFLYQTLDAIDGKQARRTNSSSPLGELFDHGCDAISQVFVTLNICHSMQLGQHRYFVLFIAVISMIVFYAAQWSTYCTGQLRFAKFDVTEAQMTVIGVLLTTGLFGPRIWSWNVFGLSFKLVVVSGSLILCLWQIGGYLKVIFSEGSGKNGSTVADTSVLSPLFPLLAVVLPFCMIYSKSTSGVYDANITLFCLLFGAVGSKAACRLVIAHMSRWELSLWDWIYVAPLVLMLNQYYDFYFDEKKLLIVATIYAYVSLLIFCTIICRQFCDYLHINCFSLKSVPGAPPRTRRAD